MGVAHSRIIYDPQNRGLDLQDYAEYHKTFISQWNVDENGRMVCREHIDMFPGIINNNFREMYKKFHEMGLLGIDQQTKEIYCFLEKW
jgi:hypothetical protein